MSTICCVIFAFLLGVFNYSLRDNIARTFGVSIDKVDALYAKIGSSADYDPIPEIPEKPMVLNTDINGTQLYSGLPDSKETRILDRSWILHETINELKGNLLVGRGSHLVEVGGWGMQSPHNFILELLLLYGIVGSVLYASIYGVVFRKIILHLKKSAQLRVLSLGIILLFTYSLVQPLIIGQLIVVAVVWVLLACCVSSGDVQVR